MDVLLLFWLNIYFVNKRKRPGIAGDTGGKLASALALLLWQFEFDPDEVCSFYCVNNLFENKNEKETRDDAFRNKVSWVLTGTNCKIFLKQILVQNASKPAVCVFAYYPVDQSSDTTEIYIQLLLQNMICKEQK